MTWKYQKQLGTVERFQNQSTCRAEEPYNRPAQTSRFNHIPTSTLVGSPELVLLEFSPLKALNVMVKIFFKKKKKINAKVGLAAGEVISNPA